MLYLTIFLGYFPLSLHKFYPIYRPLWLVKLLNLFILPADALTDRGTPNNSEWHMKQRTGNVVFFEETAPPPREEVGKSYSIEHWTNAIVIHRSFTPPLVDRAHLNWHGKTKKHSSNWLPGSRRSSFASRRCRMNLGLASLEDQGFRHCGQELRYHNCND